jgi:hypothetical protein
MYHSGKKTGTELNNIWTSATRQLEIVLTLFGINCLTNQPVHGIPRNVLYSRLGFDSSFLSLLGAEEAILKGISLRPAVCKGKNMEHITAYRTQILHMTRLWLPSNIVSMSSQILIV